MALTQVPASMMATGGVPSFDGIKFPASQSASADANTLDDYEEGGWTPTFSYATAGTTPTYTTQSGVYTKIGNIVIAQALVQLSNKGTGSGLVLIGGLPFTTSSTSLYSGCPVGYCINFSGAAPITCYVDPSSTRIVLYNPSTATYTDVTNVTNTSLVAVQVSYRVA